MLDATHLENQRLAAEVARVTADLEDVRAAAGAADVKNGDVVAVANRV